MVPRILFTQGFKCKKPLRVLYSTHIADALFFRTLNGWVDYGIFFQGWNWSLLLVPNQVFLSMENVHSFPRVVSLESPFLSTAQNDFHSPPDLFYCPGALQCHASAPFKSVWTERTQVIKITDWSAFSQIGFDPKPWNDFWAFVNLALKLKWSGQHIQYDGLYIRVGLLTVLEENL